MSKRTREAKPAVAEESSEEAAAEEESESEEEEDQIEEESEDQSFEESDDDFEEDDEFTSDDDEPLGSDEEKAAKRQRKKEQKKRRRDRLREEALERAESEKNRGVIYISRVPPNMRVQKVRHIFSQFGIVHRIYLTPETQQKGSRKGKKVSKKKLRFLDGWVEFDSKKVAKRVAFSLNNTPLGGDRRSMYYDMIWNIKYLSGFKWRQLNEKVAYDKAVRKQRIQAEFSAMKRETNEYLSSVDRAKAIQRRKAKQAAEESPLTSASSAPSQKIKKPVVFKQRTVVKGSTGAQFQKPNAVLDQILSTSMSAKRQRND